MKIVYYSLITLAFVGCTSYNEQLALAMDQNSSKVMHNYSSPKSAVKDKTQLIHIVKNTDNTRIEFWVDPFEDEVLLDFTFSEPTNSLNENYKKIDSKNEKEGDIKSDVAEKKKEEDATEKKKEEDATEKSDGKINSYSIEDYLNNYENAQAFYYAKRYSKSLISVKKAIQSNPNVAQGYKLKGTILYTLNRFDEALDAWNKALTLNPNLQDVKASIKELESNAQ